MTVKEKPYHDLNRNRDVYRAKKSPAVIARELDTGGGSRTHTSLRTMDFESIASAIPPLRHLLK